MSSPPFKSANLPCASLPVFFSLFSFYVECSDTSFRGSRTGRRCARCRSRSRPHGKEFARIRRRRAHRAPAFARVRALRLVRPDGYFECREIDAVRPRAFGDHFPLAPRQRRLSTARAPSRVGNGQSFARVWQRCVESIDAPDINSHLVLCCSRSPCWTDLLSIHGCR